VPFKQQGALDATDLVTLGSGSILQAVTLQLISTTHVQLRGVVFPSGSAVTSQIRLVSIVVNNAGAGGSGTSDVFGVYCTGIGWNSVTFADAHLNLVLIAVSSNGNGKKRGIMIDFSSGTLNMGVVRSIASNASSTGGSGTYIGLETNTTGSTAQIRFAVMGGTSADISQTSGMISMAWTQLLNTNANGYGFTPFVAPSFLSWQNGANALSNGTNYCVLSGDCQSTTETFLIVSTPTLYKGFYLHSNSGPTTGNSCTFTVRRNSIDTSLVLLMTEGVVDLNLNTVSVRFLSNDLLSLKAVCTDALFQPIGVNLKLDFF
jgi:hypothetical protein